MRSSTLRKQRQLQHHPKPHNLHVLIDPGIADKTKAAGGLPIVYRRYFGILTNFLGPETEIGDKWTE